MNLSIIVATTENNVIGYQNSIPWYLPADLKYFKKCTLNKTIILGRKTFESIGNIPLSHRRNIIISTKYKNPMIEVVSSINEALQLCKNDDEIFICGGDSIYQQTILMVNKIYKTLIHSQLNGDKFFPNIPSNFKLVNEVFRPKDDLNLYDMTFQEYKNENDIS